MKTLILTCLVLFGEPVYAQECTCASQFVFVKNYFENNNPAFQKIKTDPQALREYQTAVIALENEIDKENTEDRCNIYFEKYIDLLKDNHSGININAARLEIDFSSDEVIKDFRSTEKYKAFKKLDIDTTLLQNTLKNKPHNDIEGIYTNGGSIYFGIIKKDEKNYQAVVLRPNKYMDVGHLLLEFQQSDTHQFKSIYHLGLMGFNFQSIYSDIEIKNGQIPDFGFYKVGDKPSDTDQPYEFEVLNERTNYIGLSSFDRGLTEKLNIFYDSIATQLTSRPNLIIDIRNNGGGDEASYFKLLPYLYTKPLKIDNVEVWVSPENIKRYEENAVNIDLISRMKSAANYSFIPQVIDPVSTWQLDSITTHPKNIVILYNRKTRSSAEGMITYAMQSAKVQTAGENSGGYMGYGNVMEVTIPCGKFTLRSTTTMYESNSKYEFIGIKPRHTFKEDQDWVVEALKLFEN